MKEIYLKYNRIFLCIICISFLSLICFLFYSVRFGLEYTDGPFQLLQITSEQYDSFVMSFGTILIFKPIFSIGGDTLIWSRIISFLVSLLVVSLPVATYLCLSKCRLNVKGIVVALVAMLIPLLYKDYMFGYDTATSFALSGLLSLLIFYGFCPSFFVVVTIAIVATLCISFRLPNAVVLGLVPWAIIIKGLLEKKTKRSLVHISVFVILSLLLFYLLVVYVYGDIPLYISKLYSSVFDDKSYYGESHSLAMMLLRIKCHIYEVVEYVTVLLFFMTISSLKIRKDIYIAISVVYCVFVLTNHFSRFDVYMFSLRLYLSSIVIVMIMYLYYKKDFYIASSFSLLFVVNIVGSDTGLAKLGAFYTLPIIVFYVSEKYHKFTFSMICLLPLLLFSIYKYRARTFEDSGIPCLSSIVNNNKTKGIYTTNQRSNDIKAVMDLYEDHRTTGGEVIFVGTKRHLFEYLTGSICNVHQDFAVDFNNDRLVEEIQKYNSKYSNVLYILLSPPAKSKVETILQNSTVCSYAKLDCF